MDENLFSDLKEQINSQDPIAGGKAGAAAHETTVPPEELQKVKEIVDALTKAIKISKIYPSNNPIYQKFINELLKEKYDAYITEYGNLKLRLTQSKLIYNGAEVYDNPDRLENIALKLYADGIREITFHEGLDNSELLSFLDALNTNLDPEKTDDDMVTLLWEKNLQHITYFVIDEAAAVGEGSAAEDLTGRAPLSGFVKAEEMDTPKKRHLEAESGMPVTEEKPRQQPAPELPVYSVYTLTEDEIEQLKREKEAEENPAFTFKIIDILYEILYMERDFNAFSEVVDTLEKAIDLLISRADLVRAGRLLKNLHEISGAREKFSDEELNRVIRAIDRAGDAVRIKELGDMLNKNQAIDINALTSYLSLLNKNSAISMLELLEIGNRNIRRIVCDVITELVKDDIDLIGRKISDKRWYIVRNIVYVLGRVNNTKSIEHLKRALKYDEPRVRIEGIKSLASIGGETAKDLILTALNDKDSQVRIHAVRSLASLNHKKAVEPLINYINQEAFKKADFTEKKEFFEAIGKLGANEAFPFFKGILTKRSWLFKRTSQDELRACAAFGLGKAGTNDALNLLQAVKEKPGSIVEAARLKAISEIKKLQVK